MYKNPPPTISFLKDSNNIDVAKGTVEIDKVKIEGLDSAVEKIRDAGIYIAGITAAAKIVKSSSLPITAKLGATVGMGTASLIGYKMVHKSLASCTPHGKVTASIDKMNTSVNASTSNPNISKLMDDTSSPNNDYSITSSLDIEQLQLDFYLHTVMIYLTLLLLVFFLMKNISNLKLEFKFLEKLRYSKYTQSILIKIFKWWGKAKNIWIYALLINLLISLSISALSIYIILSHIR